MYKCCLFQYVPIIAVSLILVKSLWDLSVDLNLKAQELLERESDIKKQEDVQALSAKKIDNEKNIVPKQEYQEMIKDVGSHKIKIRKIMASRLKKGNYIMFDAKPHRVEANSQMKNNDNIKSRVVINDCINDKRSEIIFPHDELIEQIAVKKEKVKVISISENDFDLTLTYLTPDNITKTIIVERENNRGVVSSINQLKFSQDECYVIIRTVPIQISDGNYKSINLLRFY